MSEGMTVAEAGRKGGIATLTKHGPEHYRKMGKLGGDAHSRKIREEGISPELHEKLAESGHKGGSNTKKRYGREFYQEIGRKGGSVPRVKRHIDEKTKEVQA